MLNSIQITAASGEPLAEEAKMGPSRDTSMSRPRILFLTHNYPHARSYGAQLRTLHIARLLKRCGDVRVVVLPLSSDQEKGDLTKTRSEFAVEQPMLLNTLPIRGLHDRLRHEFDPWFFNTHGRALAAEDISRMARLISEHDVVWIHNVAAANSTGIRDWPNSILDVDDVLSHYHRSAFKSARSLTERAAAMRQMWLWKRRESTFLKRFSILTVCSEADRNYFGGGNRIHVVPNGFERPESEPKRALATPPRIGFIGAVSYPPTREGLNWFIRDVWPRIKNHHATARLRLVGAGTECTETHSLPNIDRLGWVEDTSSEIATWSLMIVPIHVGGGTRIKVLDGFSRKCPVVSTSVGAFGYDLAPGREILLADGADEFANACGSLLNDEQLGRQIADHAWEKYLERWSWDAIGPKVSAAVEQCLAVNRR